MALNLALRGKRVLLLDADPEANLTSLMSASYYRWHKVELNKPSTLMYALAQGDLTNAVVKMSNNLFFIPSSMDYSSYPEFLLNHYFHKTKSPQETETDYVTYLTKMMKPVEQKYHPDYVFCDIPPSGDLFEKSCLYYIGSGNNFGCLFLMMQTQQHSYQGVQYFNDFAGNMIQQYHLHYQVAGVLPVLMQKQAPSDNNVLAQAEKNYGDDMLMTPIPYRERIKRYAISGVSMPGTSPRDYHDDKITRLYSRVTDEVLDRINKVYKEM